MPALKEIVADTIGTSLLAASPMWDQAVDKIIPAQITAFVDRNAELGLRDAAESAISIAIERVAAAVDAGAMPRPSMLSYARPEKQEVSRQELTGGMQYLGDLRTAMVLFALETGLDVAEVSQLTYLRLKALRIERRFSVLAEACLECAPPRQLSLQYVFWENSEFGMPAPVFGLDADIFDAFGMVWAELTYAYNNM